MLCGLKQIKMKCKEGKLGCKGMKKELEGYFALMY